MTLTYILLMASFVLILLAAELFTNGVEWLGDKLNLTQGAVGSILAAIGTALPETIIPILAIFLARDKTLGHEISTGAILGAPLMLSTIAMAVVGASIYTFHRMGRRESPAAEINNAHMRRDLIFFLVAFSVAVSASFVQSTALKWLIASALAGIYALYVYQTLKHPGEGVEDLAPLYIAKKNDNPNMTLVAVQVIAALALMIFGAKVFVNQVEAIAAHFAVSAMVLALIIAPLATELPEKLNSVIWLKVRKDTLAVGNITGAMVFQSSVIPIVGILLTEWKLGTVEHVSIAVTLASAVCILLFLGQKNRLSYGVFALGGLFYAAFFAYVIYR